MAKSVFLWFCLKAANWRALCCPARAAPCCGRLPGPREKLSGALAVGRAGKPGVPSSSVPQRLCPHTPVRAGSSCWCRTACAEHVEELWVLGGEEGLCRHPQPCLHGHQLPATAPGVGTSCLCETPPSSQPCAAWAGRTAPVLPRTVPTERTRFSTQELKGQNTGLDVCSYTAQQTAAKRQTLEVLALNLPSGRLD